MGTALILNHVLSGNSPNIYSIRSRASVGCLTANVRKMILINLVVIGKELSLRMQSPRINAKNNV
jgi:hypothetical protein